MPDDRNLFDDDDNLIPDWMRAMEPGAFDEGDEAAPDAAPQGTPADEPSPWELLEEPAEVGDFDDFDWSTFAEDPAVPADAPLATPPAEQERFPWEPAATSEAAPEPLDEAPGTADWWRGADDLSARDEPPAEPADDAFTLFEPAEPEAAPETAPDAAISEDRLTPTLDDLEALFAAQAPVPEGGEELPPLESRPRTGALRWLDEYGAPPASSDEMVTSPREEPSAPPATPPWLRGAPTDDADDIIAGAPAGQDVPPWLRRTDEAPTPSAAESAAVDWDLDADSASAQAVPDWFRSLDQAPGQAWDDFETEAAAHQETAEASDEVFGLSDWPSGAADAPPAADDWPSEIDGDVEPREFDDAGDFVERFEPLNAEPFASAPAGDDDTTPDWLREAAPPVAPDEAALDWLREFSSSAEPDEAGRQPSGASGDDAAGIMAPPGTSSVAEPDELDWLAGLDAASVRPRHQPAPPEPDFAWPTDSVFDHEDLDSSAIDDLLSLAADSDRAPDVPPFAMPDEEDLFAEDLPEAADDALEAVDVAPFEISGVPDPFAEPADEVPDLGPLLAASDYQATDVPDLEALWDDADQSLADLFPPAAAPSALREEAPPAWEETPPAAARGGRFRWGRRQPAEEPPAPPHEEGTPPDAPVEGLPPDWLEELRPSEVPVTIKAGGAQANIHQKHVAELPERLRTFREEAMRELGETPGAERPEEVLPPPDLLAPGEVGSLVGGLVVTRAQQARVDRLRAMLEAAAEEEAVDTGSVISGMPAWATGDITPGPLAPPPPLPKRQRRARRFKADRLLITLLLLVGVLAPFATDAAFFAADPAPLSGSAAGVGRRVSALSAGDYVLFAFEYGPMSAGVLDPLAQAVLRDALAQGAIPLTTGTNPAGAFHATAVLGALRDDPALLAARGEEETALLAGEDYALLRYLPGEAVGVRTLAGVLREDNRLLPHPAFEHDLRGDPTGLRIRSVDADLALIVVISDESAAVRTWAEQLQDVAVPKIALVTEAIEPLTAPYVRAGAYVGYLAGVRDTYRYDTARNIATRTRFVMPDDLPVELPAPAESRWHSMALGAAVAAAVIGAGAILNLLRGTLRRRRR